MIKKGIAIALLALASTAASAATISTSASLGYSDTNFSNKVMTFDRFDDQGGTLELTGISFELFGELQGVAKVENFSASGGTDINALISALLKLSTVGGQELVSVLPSITKDFSASAFDGVADWEGTSGHTFDDVYASNTDISYIYDQAILDLFVGVGTMDTHLSAQADTQVSGGGNIFSGFETSAAGSVVVNYSYSVVTPPEETTPSVPVSSTFGLLGLALAGFAARRKSK